MATKVETEEYSLQRRDGVPSSASMRCRVTGITGSNWYDRLSSAADALPSYGHEISIEGYSLFLESANIAKFESTATDTAVVDLTYNQYYWASILGGNPIPTASVTSRAYETNTDKNGNPITVEHTWPASDQTIGLDGLPRGGTTETQGATVTQFETPSSLIVSVVVNYDNPGDFMRAYTGKWNSTIWQGGEPGQWKCVGSDSRYLKVSTPGRLTLCTFEFEYAELPGHKKRSVAVFRDPATGLPPDGLAEGVGYKLTDVVESANFGDII